MSREAKLLRRIALQSLPRAISLAERATKPADVEPLCDFFEAALPEEEAGMLVDFVRRNFEPKGPGRPVGGDRRPAAELKRYIINVLRERRKEWRIANGTKSLESGLLQTWIDEIFTRLGETGELHGLALSRGEIYKVLSKGKLPKSITFDD